MNALDATRVLETALICSPQPLSLRELRLLFDDALDASAIRDLLQQLQQAWESRGLELVQVASGWRGSAVSGRVPAGRSARRSASARGSSP